MTKKDAKQPQEQVTPKGLEIPARSRDQVLSDFRKVALARRSAPDRKHAESDASPDLVTPQREEAES
jgi:hypothetical protein